MTPTQADETLVTFASEFEYLSATPTTWGQVVVSYQPTFGSPVYTVSRHDWLDEFEVLLPATGFRVGTRKTAGAACRLMVKYADKNAV